MTLCNLPCHHQTAAMGRMSSKDARTPVSKQAQQLDRSWLLRLRSMQLEPRPGRNTSPNSRQAGKHGSRIWIKSTKTLGLSRSLLTKPKVWFFPPCVVLFSRLRYINANIRHYDWLEYTSVLPWHQHVMKGCVLSTFCLIHFSHCTACMLRVPCRQTQFCPGNVLYCKAL